MSTRNLCKRHPIAHHNIVRSNPRIHQLRLNIRIGAVLPHPHLAIPDVEMKNSVVVVAVSATLFRNLPSY
ncbi:MAG: hypothetical protein R2830_01085 [Saprospiraceae bacterium]